jgi:beta-1,4-N-acetylglucosaminyltransferase
MILLSKDLKDQINYFYLIQNDDELSEKKIIYPGKKIYVERARKFNESFIKSIFRSIILFFRSLKIIKKNKIDLIITCGPGIAIPVCYAAKLLAKKIIFIESWSRVSKKSTAGKLVYPISDLFFIQWKDNLKNYPKAIFAGRLSEHIKSSKKENKKRSRSKKKKIFATCGSALEFDDLTKQLDKINKDHTYDIQIQIGKGEYIPKNLKYFRYTNDMDKYYNWADLVITHTGAGTIFELLTRGKKIIVVANKLAVNNHELSINLDKEKYLKYLSVNQIKNLRSILKKDFNFKKYDYVKSSIFKKIKEFVEN